MDLDKCVSFLKQAPESTCLLLYLEKQILDRHCCNGQSFEAIAGTFSMTAAEVEKIHDRASERLEAALSRLLADLQTHGFGLDIRTLLAEATKLTNGVECDNVAA
jgi:hypothetical protein